MVMVFKNKKKKNKKLTNVFFFQIRIFDLTSAYFERYNKVFKNVTTATRSVSLGFFSQLAPVPGATVIDLCDIFRLIIQNIVKSDLW